MTLPALAPPATLDPAQPLGSQNISEGDDWIRYIQNVLKTYLVNIGGIVNASHTELNYVVGVTSLIQAQLDLKASLAQLASSTVGNFVTVIETGTTVTGVSGTHHALSNVGVTTVNLPASGRIRITPINGLATNVVGRNGGNIHSLAQDMTLTNKDGSYTLDYINATVGWRLV